MIETSGKVIKGDGFGRKLGFPTANLDRREYVRKKLNIQLGIWAGKVRIENYKLSVRRSLGEGGKIENCLAAIVIGPIDKKGLPKIEAHIIGFKGNLYGKKITIALEKYIRPFKQYKSIEILKKQIALDVIKIEKHSVS